jgi:hypothetical protein
VIVLAGLLGFFLFTQLMASPRLRRLDPARARWRRLSPRIVAWVRRAPATYTYLFVLLVTTWVLATSSSTVARELLLERSTNLHQLAQDPVRVLIASAFFVTSAPEWLLWVVLFTLVAAPLEHRLGPGRAISIFAVGHVGATLVTAAGLWLALKGDLVETSVVRAVDVGASYGFVALAGVLTYLLPRRLRWAYLGALLAGVLVAVSVGPSFTDFGHVLSLLLGLACRPLVAPALAPRRGTSGSRRA